jgi:hypothetical protein
VAVWRIIIAGVNSEKNHREQCEDVKSAMVWWIEFISEEIMIRKTVAFCPWRTPNGPMADQPPCPEYAWPENR